MSTAAEPERGRLSREAIVATAVRLVEAEGEDAASMRRISAELGVAAMSLYNHIPSKAALLDAVGDHVWSQIQLPSDPGLSWEDRARELVRAFRNLVRAYPHCTALTMTRAHFSAAGLQSLEFALEMAHQAGFTDQAAVQVVRAFEAYAVGATTTAANRARLAESLLTGDSLTEIPAEDYPRICGLGVELFALDDERDFEFGLDLLITAITALRTD